MEALQKLEILKEQLQGWGTNKADYTFDIHTDTECMEIRPNWDCYISGPIVKDVADFCEAMKLSFGIWMDNKGMHIHIS